MIAATKLTTDQNGAGWIPFNPNFSNDDVIILFGMPDTNIIDRIENYKMSYNGASIVLYKGGQRVASKSVTITWIAIGDPR